MVELVRQEPAQHGVARARWRLDDVRDRLPWLAHYTRSGVWRALRRQRVRLKRGRLRTHSPDPAYAAKLTRLARARTLARRYPERVTLVYADETSVFRQPQLAPVWWPVGHEPTRRLSQRSNTRQRICAALDVVTGRVTYLTGSAMRTSRLRAFLRQVRAAYPDRYVCLAWDNWPVHAHPTVLAEARAQRITILWLPTYAPWTNPTEKLWRHLKQRVVYRHRFADDWDGLKAAITAHLDQFTDGSTDLLRYTGLWED